MEHLLEANRLNPLLLNKCVYIYPLRYSTPAIRWQRYEWNVSIIHRWHVVYQISPLWYRIIFFYRRGTEGGQDFQFLRCRLNWYQNPKLRPTRWDTRFTGHELIYVVCYSWCFEKDWFVQWRSLWPRMSRDSWKTIVRSRFWTDLITQHANKKLRSREEHWLICIFIATFEINQSLCY